MTQIHISIRKPKTGGLDPVTGVMRFRPVRRHFDAAKNLVIAASFDADLSEDGELTVDLLPTTGAFVWQVIELADTPQAYTRYVEVPNSKTKVEYADLVEVDAGTFVPKDMTGSQLLKVRRASTQSEAETLSAQYPDELVFFDETATTARAAMAMSTLESITAEAQTNAALAKSAMLSARSSADSATAVQSNLNVLASNASVAAASVANDSQTVADTANAVAAKGESDIATIDSTVQAVKDKAEAATTVLPSTGTAEETTEETTEEPGKDSTPAKAKKATVKEA
ncbi:hypothetical protein [Bifidobacterium pseudocatenulatum]|mgnify:FL=1|jgi:hypothetical protein|uniref:hypothetical protein n=1 Tax=Bifidobacterium pseudocatenulatum TaxID=28026 RepID=UPI000E447FCC|nr:hypothetical protein [Bifidobacterium pseudocatenulatum]UWI10373.1 MAG: hypothetical protein [Bacteriophage sp.]GDZ04549.1 hypothetical protein MCC01992_18480 [Bifidobacteriaceae bacterium MCC01992]MCB4866245.1 hypothetical protein [Bifidobacterium pseudocatenulatum]RGJ86615.1 hypothetical protein DXD43_00990 [Bifidobacterium pseudocatenulatum]RHG81258.1 hypothetical protein DW239_03710 [Bifidobacterium pseudocatenulatum]